MAEYLTERTEWLRGRRICERCGKYALRLDVHHVAGRLGDFLMDKRWWMALCRKCHSWTHDNPASAKAEGLLVPREVALGTAKPVDL